MFLNAFSFEHEPHIIVVMLSNPFGATDINIDCKRLGQSLPGNTPRAGRLIKAKNIRALKTGMKIQRKQFYILSYASIRILLEARDDYSPKELTIFAYKCPVEHFHRHRPSNFQTTYRNRQIVERIQHSENKLILFHNYELSPIVRTIRLGYHKIQIRSFLLYGATLLPKHFY